MKKKLFPILVIFMLVSACGPQPIRAFDQFNLNQNAQRVYYYQAYQPSSSDPAKTIKATFQLAEVVVERTVVPSYVVAHAKRQLKLIQADPNWSGDTTTQVTEIWYVISGQRVYSQKTAVDPTNIKVSDMTLSYDFPLTPGKTWCPQLYDPKDASHKQITDCRLSGQREVIGPATFTSGTDSFSDCYNLVDHYSDGQIFQRFCTGVGVVMLSFDHVGTNFGFKQNLSTYLIGTP